MIDSFIGGRMTGSIDLAPCVEFRHFTVHYVTALHGARLGRIESSDLGFRMRDELQDSPMTARHCRRRPARRWLLQSVLLGLLTPPLARAAALAEPDTRAVRTVIEAQLQAFAANDAERAFSYASPSIRAQFGNAATFMAMVQTAYPMLIRPAAVAFFQPLPTDGGVWQKVQFRDRAGHLWLATYHLQQQALTGWRITACAVVADSGKSST